MRNAEQQCYRISAETPARRGILANSQVSTVGVAAFTRQRSFHAIENEVSSAARRVVGARNGSPTPRTRKRRVRCSLTEPNCCCGVLVPAFALAGQETLDIVAPVV